MRLSLFFLKLLIQLLFNFLLALAYRLLKVPGTALHSYNC